MRHGHPRAKKKRAEFRIYLFPSSSLGNLSPDLGF